MEFFVLGLLAFLCIALTMGLRQKEKEFLKEKSPPAAAVKKEGSPFDRALERADQKAQNKRPAHDNRPAPQGPDGPAAVTDSYSKES